MLRPGSLVVLLELFLVLVQALHVPGIFDELILPKLVCLDVLEDLVLPLSILKSKCTKHQSPCDRPETVRYLLRHRQGLDVLVFDPNCHIVPKEGHTIKQRLAKCR